MRLGRVAAALVLGVASVGCSSPSLYEWGRYEESVYVVTRQPDGFDLAAEIDSLETQLEVASNEERPLPPGFHAHLGYLLTVKGDKDGARRHFEAEKELFPESSRFMDQLIERLTRS